MKSTIVILASILCTSSVQARTPLPPPAKVAPAAIIAAATRVLPGSGLRVDLPAGWRATLTWYGSMKPAGYSTELIDQLERHGPGQPSVDLVLAATRDCKAFFASAVDSAKADPVTQPAWLPAEWSASAYQTGKLLYACNSFRQGTFAVTIDLGPANLETTLAAELSALLRSLARGAGRHELDQYPPGAATPLSVTGLMLQLPATPAWFVRVGNSGEGAHDLLTRVQTGPGQTSLAVMLSPTSDRKCSTVLGRLNGKAASKPRYLPASWTPKVIEVLKPGSWVAGACLASGPKVLRAILVGDTRPSDADAQQLIALLGAAATAKLARDGADALPSQEQRIKVSARQLGLVVSLPTGSVDWDLWSWGGEDVDIFTRVRPATPSIKVTTGKSRNACTHYDNPKLERKVAQPRYAPADWGVAYESLGKPTVIDARVCRNAVWAQIELDADASARDLSDVRALLAAIGSAAAP